jgi:hypothetical protein
MPMVLMVVKLNHLSHHLTMQRKKTLILILKETTSLVVATFGGFSGVLLLYLQPQFLPPWGQH